jgi:SNF2 family DNA or RNA helicase
MFYFGANHGQALNSMLNRPQYIPPLPPRAKQAEALAKMHGKKAFALLMGMRTGKSKVLLDDWAAMVVAGEVRDLLVIGPAGALPPWGAELKKQLAPDLYAQARIHFWKTGSGKEHNQKLQALLAERDRPRALFINVEALSTVEKAREAARTFLSPGNAVMAIDESTVVKSHKSERTHQAIMLGKLAKYRRILTGLPTPRSPLDLFSQCEFLDPSILRLRSYWAFRARYAVLQQIQVFAGTKPDGTPRHRKVDIEVGYRNVDELWKLIEPYSFRCRLEDCYDVPESEYLFRDVEMTKDQRRMYDELLEFATTEIENGTHTTATMTMTNILRRHQLLCGIAVDENHGLHAVPEHRTAALIELLREYDGKAIIWCSYDANVRRVSEALNKEFGDDSLVRFWGGNRNEREAEETRFKTDPKCRFMVATPAAGGRGRTWDVADLVVYFSNSHDLEHRQQSEERAKSVGRMRPVTYVDLRVPGTVEDKIIACLRKKLDIAAVVQGEGARAWLV